MPSKKDEQPNEKPEYIRTMMKNGREVVLRTVPVSKEALKKLGDAKFRTIYQHIAVNPPKIEREFAKLRGDIKRDMAMMQQVDREQFVKKPIDFVANKAGYSYYEVRCTNCGDVIANVWATDDTLKDWCDLHYMCWHDENTWYGAMAVNVSPIDGQLGFECACGEDTRDYRNNRALPPVVKSLMVEYTMKHRDFGKPTSKFIAMKKGK